MKVSSHRDARHFRRLKQGKMREKCTKGKERTSEKESYRDMHKGNFSEIEI